MFPFNFELHFISGPLKVTWLNFIVYRDVYEDTIADSCVGYLHNMGCWNGNVHRKSNIGKTFKTVKNLSIFDIIQKYILSNIKMPFARDFENKYSIYSISETIETPCVITLHYVLFFASWMIDNAWKVRIKQIVNGISTQDNVF